ncbi:MAG: hypothetical protein KY462_15420 [Actinobacteria bacterium]|nr:hypothetical protein [Actinomycetota bacterium]
MNAQPPDREDEDFSEAWERRDELDVGAPTGQWSAFRAEQDTAEVLRRQVHGEEELTPARTDQRATMLLAGVAVVVVLAIVVWLLVS